MIPISEQYRINIKML